MRFTNWRSRRWTAHHYGDEGWCWNKLLEDSYHGHNYYSYKLLIVLEKFWHMQLLYVKLFNCNYRSSVQPEDECLPPSVVWSSTKQQRSTLLTVPWAYYPCCMSIFCVAVCACSSSCRAIDEEEEEGSAWVSKDFVWSQFAFQGDWGMSSTKGAKKHKHNGKSERELPEVRGSSGGI